MADKNRLAQPCPSGDIWISSREGPRDDSVPFLVEYLRSCLTELLTPSSPHGDHLGTTLDPPPDPSGVGFPLSIEAGSCPPMIVGVSDGGGVGEVAVRKDSAHLAHKGACPSIANLSNSDFRPSQSGNRGGGGYEIRTRRLATSNCLSVGAYDC